MIKKLPSLLLLLLVLCLSFSCQNDEMDSMFIRNDGSLKVKLADGEGKGIPEVEVRLFNYATENEIDFQTTSENGEIDFGRLTAGNYSIALKTTHNEKWYAISKEVQIHSSIDKVEEIILDEYFGSVEVQVVEENESTITEEMNLKVIGSVISKS